MRLPILVCPVSEIIEKRRREADRISSSCDVETVRMLLGYTRAIAI
ncbi:MAG: hypothetical protein HC887_07595 [Desulfobacteraceae bacterium]|nr:hypothetical protein [Desulfobacteraceae bacterium]